MSWYRIYAKAIAAIFGAVTMFALVVEDGMSTKDWAIVAIAAMTAIGVRQLPNGVVVVDDPEEV